MQPDRTHQSDRRPQRHGAAAAELAIVLPLLVTLCLMSVDLGRFAYAYIALGNAARNGAEFGATRRYDDATSGQWEAGIEQAVRAEFSDVDCLDPDLLQIEIDVQSDAYDLHRVEVTATYPFLTVVAWPSLPRPIPMQRTVVFRRFR